MPKPFPGKYTVILKGHSYKDLQYHEAIEKIRYGFEKGCHKAEMWRQPNAKPRG